MRYGALASSRCTRRKPACCQPRRSVSVASTVATKSVVAASDGWRSTRYAISTMGSTVVAVVFVGGPVSQNTAIGLARSSRDDGAEGWQQVAGDVGMFNMAAADDGTPDGVTDLRVFAGYAGWGPGQLDGEIDAGAWLVLDADVGDI